MGRFEGFQSSGRRATLQTLCAHPCPREAFLFELQNTNCKQTLEMIIGLLYHVATQLAEEHCFTTSVLTVRVMARCVLLLSKCASSTTTDKHKHKPMHKKLTHMCLIPEILRRRVP